MRSRQKFKCVAIGLVLTSIPLFAACAPTAIDWTEEVKLHDGKIIVVKRHDELGASGLPQSRRGLRKFWQFCYAPMKIHWKSKPDYFPETFDIVDGKAYVRVTIDNCELCMLHGYPDTTALYFIWDGGAWRSISFKDFPAGLRYNMLNTTHYDDDGSRDVRGLVTIAQKEQLDREIYWLMSKKPEIIGLNDREIFGRNGRESTRDVCKRCRGIQGKTNSTADVFLPADRNDCN